MRDLALNTPPKQEVDYEEWYHSTRHSNHFNLDYYKARAKIAVQKFFSGIPENCRILDYGCGLGQNIFYMPNAMGFDISEYGIRFCREKGINATTKLEEIPDEGFDLVFTAHVLEHHPNPKSMIEDMRRKLKRGQRLIIVIPHERHGRAGFSLDLNQHLFSWNFRTINNLLLTSGFQIKANRYVRGAGYFRLLSLARINFGLYRWATNTVSRIMGIREIMVVATKL
jgi:SAM-dependent methyltransferase